MTSRATSLRLLLLLLALTGVACMHTIGHPVGAGQSTAGHSSAATGLGLHEAEPADAMSDGGRVDERDTGMVMNPLNVCLAVLLGGILLLLVGVLRRMRRGEGHKHYIVPAFVRAGRGPPGVVWCGLALADLSVQRT